MEIIEAILNQCPDLLPRASKALKSVLSGIQLGELQASFAPDREGRSLFEATLLRYPIMGAVSLLEDNLSKSLGHVGTVTAWKSSLNGDEEHEKTAHMAATRLIWEMTSSAAEKLHDDLGHMGFEGVPLNAKPYRGLVFWSELDADWVHFASQLWKLMPVNLRQYYADELATVNMKEVRRLLMLVEQEGDRYLTATAEVNLNGKRTDSILPDAVGVLSGPTSKTLIHPAKPATAFWFLKSALCDLLCWSEHPDPEPLGSQWLGKISSDLTEKADAALRSVEHLPDKTLTTDIKRARQLGVKFATLLCDNPSLSTVRVQDWPIPRFQEMFNELSDLETRFARLSTENAVSIDPTGRRIVRGLVERDDKADPVTHPKRATQNEVGRGTMAAIGHLLTKPEATGKECARVAGMSPSTLSKQPDWITWKTKIASATASQRMNYKESYDNRTSEFQAIQPDDDC